MRDLWMVWNISLVVLLPLTVLVLAAWKRDWGFFASNPDSTILLVAILVGTAIALFVYSKIQKIYEVTESGIIYRKNREIIVIPFQNVRVYYYEKDRYGEEDRLVIEEWNRSFSESHTIPIRKLRRRDMDFLIETMKIACVKAAAHPRNIFRTTRGR